METLESSRVCRLCGQHSGICINIFDKNENHVKKINAVLPILVHEMDLLPKQMCHRCSYKLEEFHKFYSDCLKTDMDLKGQLSWMRKREVKEQIRVPMVQIENVKIKSEPPDYDIYELDPIVENVNYISSMNSMTFSMNSVRNNNDVDSSIINNVDRTFNCDNRLADCAHCKCNYGKRNTKRETAMSINCTNIKSKHDIKIDSNSTEINNFQNNPASNNFNGLRETMQPLSKVKQAIKVNNVSDVSNVQEIKIKTEKPDDDVVTRTLRPRKKSIDYIGTKRKKSNLIINPASVNKNLEVAKKITIDKQTDDRLANQISVDRIKKEPVDDTERIILRPRKFLIDYVRCERKELARDKSDVENRSSNEVVRSKRCRSSSVLKANLNSGTRKKRSTGLMANPVAVKVKEEIISDNETTKVEENNKQKLNGGSDSCVRNLSNLFSRETKLEIKVENNTEEELESRGSRMNRGSNKNISKLKPRNVESKRISDTNCSPKYLRSQNLRLRNGKVKEIGSGQKLSLKNLKKKFLQLATTGRELGRNFEKKLIENSNVIKVPTSLRTVNNIKHFCEKCCTSFINKELYMLHVCYFE